MSEPYSGFIEEIKLTILKLVEKGKWVTYNVYEVKCQCGRKYEIKHMGIQQKARKKNCYCQKCSPLYGKKHKPKNQLIAKKKNNSLRMFNYINTIREPPSLKNIPYY